MDRRKKEIIITVILVVIFLAAIIINVTRQKHPRKGKELVVSLKVKEGKSPSKSVKANADIIALQKKRAELAWGRDPFFFTKIKKFYKGQQLLLKGISLGKDGRGYAFVNDEIVTVGDVVGGYKVMEIKRDKILLKKGSDTFYLGMPAE